MPGGDDDRRFSLADVAFGEALVRVSAHLDNALAAYDAGQIETALVHASRPMVELMPRISRDLWRDPQLGKALNGAAAGVASAIRLRKPATELAAARERFDNQSARAVGTVVGDDAWSAGYRASVVVALLRTAAAALEAEHPDALSIVARARALAENLWGGALVPERVHESFEELNRAGSPSATDVKAKVTAIAEALHGAFGAVLELDPEPREVLATVAKLLHDAADAARTGESFLAGKLVGRAYVEEYVPLRTHLATWEEEPELNDLVGTRIRRALAGGNLIDDLVSRANALIARAPL